MVIGTGISLWRYLAQSQVDSQTHAERRINYSFIYTRNILKQGNCTVSLAVYCRTPV